MMTPQGELVHHEPDVYGARTEPVDVFIIMPFGKEFDAVHGCVEEAAKLAKPGLRVQRLDNRENETAGMIHRRLESTLRKCKMCIADITGRNPNVMWEAGFAAALRKPVLFITQDTFRDAPFDIAPLLQIQYDAKNLGDAFTRRVIQTIRNTLNEFTDWHEIDADPGFLKACLLSVGSPVYFLDMRFDPGQNGDPEKLNYRVRHMNKAAGMIFEVSPEELVGGPLDEFLAGVKPRLLNYDRVESNFKEQTEKIIRHCKSRQYAKISGYHVEDVELDHTDYRRIILQKVAVAVRDSCNDPVRGWAVTFNIKDVNDENLRPFFAQLKGAVQDYRL